MFERAALGRAENMTTGLEWLQKTLRFSVFGSNNQSAAGNMPMENIICRQFGQAARNRRVIDQSQHAKKCVLRLIDDP